MRHAKPRVRARLDRPQHMEAIASRWCFDTQAGKAPQKAKKRGKDPRDSLDNKDDAVSSCRFVQTWLSLFFLPWACFWLSALAGIIPPFLRRSPIDGKNGRPGVSPLRIPGRARIISLASVIVAGGFAIKSAAMVDAGLFHRLCGLYKGTCCNWTRPPCGYERL